ncbi:MAG: formylglycine-generating enzyme family protein [Pseudomonadota bacterium]
MKVVVATRPMLLSLIGLALAACSGTQHSGEDYEPTIVPKPIEAVLLSGYVRIEPGCFTMGSPPDEPGRGYDETQHRVCISRPFFLKATEVTQKEWRALMGNNPSRFDKCGDECPVEQVNWFEALVYCNAASRSEGLPECYRLEGCTGTLGGGCGANDWWCDGDYMCSKVEFAGLGCTGYRLPTDAEWEYAARAGSRTATYAGAMEIKGVHNAPALDGISWYCGNSGVTYSGGFDCLGRPEKQRASSRCGTHPVGAKRANAWGLSDMLGNVWEWCWDWYGTYGGEARDPLGAETGSYRVLRGGSWEISAGSLRAASRNGSASGDRGGDLGFRPARSSP